MPKIPYICDSCGNEFKLKREYNKHVKKCIPAVDNNDNQAGGNQVDSQVEDSRDSRAGGNSSDQAADSHVTIIYDTMARLHGMMTSNKKKYIDYMPDAVRILFMRIIKPYLNNTLATLLDEKQYTTVSDLDHNDLRYLDISELLTLPDSDGSFENMIGVIYKLILGNHPLTSGAFKQYKYKPDIGKLRECLIHVCESLDGKFDDMTQVQKKEAFEYFLDMYHKTVGPSFGTHIVPSKLVKLMHRLTKAYSIDERKSVYDPVAGVSSFLTEAHSEFGIDSTGMHGHETDPDNYLLGIMHCLLATGSICHVTYKDAILDNSITTFDMISTGPRISNIKRSYDNIKAQLDSKTSADTIPMSSMYPIDTNDSAALYIQHCISKLAIGGICSIVIPNGGIFYGNAFTKLRKYLLDTCEVHAVMVVPERTFPCNPTRTAAIFFSKTRNSNNKPIRTSAVDFYTCDVECKDFQLVSTVTRNEFEEHEYKLTYNTYIDDTIRVVDSTLTTTTLADICEIVNGPEHQVSEGSAVYKEGTYPLLCNSTNGKVRWLPTYDYEDKYLVFGTGCTANIHIYEKFSVSAHMYVMKPKCDMQYLYCYLQSRLPIVGKKYFNGLNMKHIHGRDFKSIPVLLPPAAEQKAIGQAYAIYKDKLACYEDIIRRCEAEQDNYIEFAKIQLSKLRMLDRKKIGDVCKILTRADIKKLTNKGITTGSFIAMNKSDPGHVYTCEDCSMISDEHITMEPSGNILPEYIVAYVKISSARIRSLYESIGSSVVTIELLSDIDINIPSIEDQIKFVDVFAKIQRLIDASDANKKNAMEMLNGATADPTTLLLEVYTP